MFYAYLYLSLYIYSLLSSIIYYLYITYILSIYYLLSVLYIYIYNICVCVPFCACARTEAFQSSEKKINSLDLLYSNQEQHAVKEFKRSLQLTGHAGAPYNLLYHLFLTC